MQPRFTRQQVIDCVRNQGWIRHCDWFAEIDSTSNFARRFCDTPQPLLPAVFVADQQTHGRGRSANRWWSPSGCLMMTLAITQDDLPSEIGEQKLLSLVSGVAVCEAVEKLAPSLSIQLKWPNDLYVADRKLGGILIESLPQSSASGQTLWLVGIGLNVDVDWRNAPLDLQTKAICISSTGAGQFQSEQMFLEIITSVRDWLRAWSKGNADWFAPYNQRSLLTDRLVRVRLAAESQFVGRCEGIDRQGRLLCRSELEVRALSNGEIVDWSR